MVLLRKSITIEKRKKRIWDKIRYFFYITNRRELAWYEVLEDANQRCNQENVIEQLKNGGNAIRVPVHDLESNRACIVMAALGWNLRTCYGLIVPNRERGINLARMEFRTLLGAALSLPTQIIRAGRKIIYRILGYNSWMTDFFATWHRLRRLEAT